MTAVTLIAKSIRLEASSQTLRVNPLLFLSLLLSYSLFLDQQSQLLWALDSQNK